MSKFEIVCNGMSDFVEGENMDIETAQETADNNACYCQESIIINDANEEEPSRIRRWWNTLDGLADNENPIQFGDFGYYADWEIME